MSCRVPKKSCQRLALANQRRDGKAGPPAAAKLASERDEPFALPERSWPPTNLRSALLSPLFGFDFIRPRFASGASLAVEPDEQNAVAGTVTSINGVAYIAAPATAATLYAVHRPLAFIAVAVVMLGRMPRFS
jgi:hypothetical protein